MHHIAKWRKAVFGICAMLLVAAIIGAVVRGLTPDVSVTITLGLIGIAQAFFAGESRQAPDTSQPIIHGQLSISGMDATCRIHPDGQPARAHAAVAGGSASIQFSLTNPNALTANILSISVDVQSFHEVVFDKADILMGAAMPIRPFECSIEPRTGSFLCVFDDPKAEYVRLAPAESERFQVNIKSDKPGFYRFRIVVKYEIGAYSHSHIVGENGIEVAFMDQDDPEMPPFLKRLIEGAPRIKAMYQNEDGSPKWFTTKPPLARPPSLR